ncbi:MAG TPA: GNAT family N-acetyltransferase [Acidimicrobiales bacterium]|jgi:GNAT superfamily N-acetyltransferase|nr:GNAT family N-acetyltransferase [Acidimicrobiales bacterium]
MPPGDAPHPTIPSTGGHGGAGDVTVARVDPAVTYALRSRVLRDGAPPERARLPVDDLPDTAAFAATAADGTVVGTAIVYPEACPWQPDRPGAWRLRGMATDPAWRSRGVGGRVLAALLAHVADQGGALVWCNARTPARRFYQRAGFRTHGEPWEDPEIGPHIAMWRPL